MRKRAFTVVELLVVIAIISTLIALLLPAVQFAREVARKGTCSNNIRQIAMAATAHSSTFDYFPNAGGRDGSPRSKTSDGRPQGALAQDWGVFYQILPYVEQKGAYEASDTEAAALKFKIYACPTRRPPSQVKGSTQNGLTANDLRGTIDYAGNGGGGNMGDVKDGATFVAMGMQYDQSLSNQNGVIVPRPNIQMGQISRKITTSEIADGLSNVVMFGERQFNRRPPAAQQDEDNGYFNGWSWDTIRWGFMGRPEADRNAAIPAYSYKFGGPHSGITLLATCDGAVRSFRNNSVDDLTFRKLCHRFDATQISPLRPAEFPE